jgi:hypothetical protein
MMLRGANGTHEATSKEQAMRNPCHVAQIGSRTACAERARFRNVALVAAVAASFLLPTIGSAASLHGKRNPGRAWHGYGFLPGYRTPEQIEWERARNRAPAYWYGGPGFYRGRWNGGGFGPCWTPTPIGPIWNCG